MKPFALLLLVGAFGACQSHRNTPLHATLFAYGNGHLAQYDQYIAELDTQLTAVTIAAQKFRSLFRGQSPAVCDTGYYLFEQLVKKTALRLNRQMQADTMHHYEALLGQETGNGKTITPSQQLLAYQQQLTANGFMVKCEKGVPAVMFNRDFIVKYFYSYVSRPMKQYLEQLNTEEKEVFDTAGKPALSPVELADRTVWWEKFAAANTSFLFAAQAKEFRETYSRFLLKGTEETVTGNDAFLSAYYQKAFAYIQEKYRDTDAGMAVSAYLDSRHHITATKPVADNH